MAAQDLQVPKVVECKLRVRPLQPDERAARRQPDDSARAAWDFVPRPEWAKKRADELRKAVHGLSAAEAQDVLAYVYGYPAWHVYRKAVLALQVNTDLGDEALQPRDVIDERLSPSDVHARRAYQAQRLFECVSLDLAACTRLIEQLRPSDRKTGLCDYEATAATHLLHRAREDEQSQIAADRQWWFVPSAAWATAKAETLRHLLPDLSRPDALHAMAFIYGFRAWDHMMEAVLAGSGTGLQRLADDRLRLEALEERRHFQVQRARRVLWIDAAWAWRLIQQLKPSAWPNSEEPLVPGEAPASSLEDEYDQRVWQQLHRNS